MTLDQLIAGIRSQIATKLAEREQHTAGIAAIRATLTTDNATLTEDQVRTAGELDAKRSALDVSIGELRAQEAMYVAENERQAESEKLMATYQAVAPTPGVARSQVVSESNPVYRKGDLSTSYFRDIYNAGHGERAAQDRLIQSQTRTATTVANSGGQFAPPLWLVDDFVALARAGRVTADLMNRQALPGGVSSINLPQITVGAGTGVTQTQNTAITESGITSASVSSGISTISGKQVVAIELVRQSGTPIDQVILQDLAQSYAVSLDIQVIRGSGTAGQLRGLVTAGTQYAFTTATPLVVSSTAASNFYGKVLGAKNNIETTRFMPATAIVMHARRWNWILNGQDASLRPVVAPAEAPAFNGIGAANTNGFTGHIFAGLPVYIDSNIDTTTEQVFVLRTDDLWLFESEPELASFDATLADQNSILFRVLGFAAFIPDRYNYACSYVSGTGITTVTF